MKFLKFINFVSLQTFVLWLIGRTKAVRNINNYYNDNKVAIIF